MLSAGVKHIIVFKEIFNKSKNRCLNELMGAFEKLIKLMDLDYSIEIVTHRGIHGNKNLIIH